MLHFASANKAIQYLSNITGRTIRVADAVEEVIEPMFPIQYAKERLKSKGFKDNLKMLGHGENGYAFEDGNKVVKITADKSEYDTAQKLLKSPMSNIVNIHKAIKVTDKFDGAPQWWIEYWGYAAPRWEELQDLYIIVSEKLKPLSNKQIKQIDDMIESGVSNNITKQTKDIEKNMNKFGVKFYDLRADNLGLDENGRLKLLDVGGSY